MSYCIYLGLGLSLQTLALALIVPEVQPSRVLEVSKLVSAAFGDDNRASSSSAVKADRYNEARNAVAAFGENAKANVPSHEFVYGELSVEVLAKILDAVGVEDGDVFLDIGSGDGALVLGASLLYARENNSNSTATENPIKKAVGVEIVPGLVGRSRVHADNLDTLLRESQSTGDDLSHYLLKSQAEVEFLLGDVHRAESDETMSSLLSETTLIVCFATTWSHGNAKKGSTSLQGRKLPKLSKALSGLGSGARVVIIDGALNESDGFNWQGDLKIYCPDTAPYSIASLYHRQ